MNTGWAGGPCGVADRMPLALTRQLVRAALSGEIDRAGFDREPVFGLRIPRACPGVPGRVLEPRGAWDDPAAYDRQARMLSEMFEENAKELGIPAPSAASEAPLVPSG